MTSFYGAVYFFIIIRVYNNQFHQRDKLHACLTSFVSFSLSLSLSRILRLCLGGCQMLLKMVIIARL